jgi:hypothetical protein
VRTSTLIEIGVAVVAGCGIPLVIAFFLLVAGLGVWRARRRATAWAAAMAPPPWELWAAGAWGLWSGAEDSAGWDRQRAVDALNAWYGAADAAGLRATIDGLMAGQTGNAAWDQARAVDLVRIGQAAGYLTPDDAAGIVRRIAADLRRRYTSWEALAAGFEAGMHAWQDGRGITDEAARGRVQRNLPHLRAVAWPGSAWGAAL